MFRMEPEAAFSAAVQAAFETPVCILCATSEEHVLSMQMQTAFSNFAKSGNPNMPVALPTQSGKNTLTWDNYDFNQDNVFKFDTPSSNENNLRKKFCDYFDTIGYYRTG